MKKMERGEPEWDMLCSDEGMRRGNLDTSAGVLDLWVLVVIISKC
jgi:hypothetical protein